MSDADSRPQADQRLGPDAVAKARLEWEPWCRALYTQPEYLEATLDAAVGYLDKGLSAEVVAALIELRAGLSRNYQYNRDLVRWESDHCERLRRDLPGLRESGVLSNEAATALDREYSARQLALATWTHPIAPPAAVTAATQARSQPGRPQVEPIPAAQPPPAPPPGPPFSFRDLFAEHSVLILGSFGAFLLVVATVLFELYGTVGLGGSVRFAAVVVLDLLFAAAGFGALRLPNLRSLGQIYTALGAVLLPLVGLAAWTFLELDKHGITVDQALTVVGAACAATYGVLALRLDLRAYAEMAGLAILVAAWGGSGWVGGSHWRAVGLALTPLAYGAWERYLRARVFSHFQWFAHAAAGVAIVTAGSTLNASDWLWTFTLASLGVAYLAWQAISPQRPRAWAGEAAIVLASTAASGPLGFTQYHFLFPMTLGLALLLLARVPDRLGVVGRMYHAHPALLHLAVASGLLLAGLENVVGGERWPVAGALWVGFTLYIADFWLGDEAASGYALRAALPLALAATGEALRIDTWTATLVALSLFAYLAPWVVSSVPVLRARSSYFFYGVLALTLLSLDPFNVGAGMWPVPVALLALSVGFAVAAELKAVRVGDWAARGLFSLGWLATVDAFNAQGWRGPFDAILPLFYTALAQVRALRTRAVAVTGRRWFVHATGAAAIGLCFAGPDDQLWWRLTVAFGLLTVAYWWQELRSTQIETPWLAWTSTAMFSLSLILAAVDWHWQGAIIVGAAIVLTAGWAAVRSFHRTLALEETGFFFLSALVIVGSVLALRDQLPQWHQAIAALGVGLYLVAWSALASTPRMRETVPVLRSVAAAFAAIGVLLGAATLRLDAAYVGLIAIAIAVAHAEWSVRAQDPIERWYSMGAVIALAPVIYYWPYSHSLPALMALELIALGAVLLAAGLRRRRWYLAYPAALVLVPALDQILVALGLAGARELEDSFIAGLAWAIGFAGLVTRPFAGRMWALSVQAAGVTVAVIVLTAMSGDYFWDPSGIALLAYAPEVYGGAMQERNRWGLPAAPATALLGAVVLLSAHQADTIYYAAALGVVGLIVWVAGRVAFVFTNRDQLVDMHRYLGLGLLGASGLAGFFFPDRTGPATLGAVLAAIALLATGGVLWLDMRTFAWRPNFYLAIFSASCAGYFLARYVSLTSWELVSPGLGAVACGILLRQDPRFTVQRRIRQLVVVFGLGLVMGWSATFTVSGDLYWLVVLLLEGAVTVAAGVVLRSRVMLAVGGAAVAVVSLRALLTVAQAGYLFAAFAAVAAVLLIVATVLALGRDRFFGGQAGLRERLAGWD